MLYVFNACISIASAHENVQCDRDTIPSAPPSLVKNSVLWTERNPALLGVSGRKAATSSERRFLQGECVTFRFQPESPAARRSVVFLTRLKVFKVC
jgi:hypothetical protein